MTNEQIIEKYGNMPTGVYRELIDSTRQDTIDNTVNFVVVGQFSKGPIMNPVYCPDVETLHAVFGKRDVNLEQRGCYGVLMSEHVLPQGPIWVLNIKNISAQSETVETVHIARTTAEDTVQEPVAINEVYDTSNFWKLDQSFATRGDAAGLTFTSVQNGKISVIVQKGYYPNHMYTVAETKAEHDQFLGANLDDNRMVSDYMVTVHIFKSDVYDVAAQLGNITCFKLVGNGGAAQDVKVIQESSTETLASVIANPAFKYFKSYDGTVADVINMAGENLNIANMINADTMASGTSCALNVDALIANGIDLLGLSDPSFDPFTQGSPISGLSMFNGTQITDVNNVEAEALDSGFYYVGGELYMLQKTGSIAPTTILTPFSDGTQGTALTLALGDKLNFDDSPNDHRVFVTGLNYVKDVYDKGATAFDTVTRPLNPQGLPYKKNNSGQFIYDWNHPWAGQVVTFDLTTPGSETWLDFWDGYALPATQSTWTIQNPGPATIPAANFPAIYDAYCAKLQMIKVSVSGVVTPAGLTATVINLDDDTTVNGYVPNGNSIDRYNPVAYPMSRVYILQGIVDLQQHYVNGTVTRQNAILDQLTTPTIMNSFSDPTVFRCRYMIDAFKTYIEASTKAQFATLAAKCKRFPVFTSFPAHYELKASVNPDFHDLLGRFQMSYVLAGKNPDKLSTNSFSYPNTPDLGPWLIPTNIVEYNDGFQSSMILGVGALARLYYQKWSGTYKTYDIIGGKDWPILTTGITCPEKQYDLPTRGHLENIGVNLIQKSDNVLQLRSSRTAYQANNSALNAPETIEKFLHLTDTVEPVIESKQFKYNDINSRNAILSAANTVCEGMKADGAISDYENICDLSNNTPAVRSRGIIILDSILYNEFGIRIGVHQTELRLPQA